MGGHSFITAQGRFVEKPGHCFESHMRAYCRIHRGKIRGNLKRIFEIRPLRAVTDRFLGVQARLEA